MRSKTSIGFFVVHFVHFLEHIHIRSSTDFLYRVNFLLCVVYENILAVKIFLLTLQDENYTRFVKEVQESVYFTDVLCV